VCKTEETRESAPAFKPVMGWENTLDLVAALTSHIQYGFVWSSRMRWSRLLLPRIHGLVLDLTFSRDLAWYACLQITARCLSMTRICNPRLELPRRSSSQKFLLAQKRALRQRTLGMRVKYTGVRYRDQSSSLLLNSTDCCVKE
jgi:hypothetical protein